MFQRLDRRMFQKSSNTTGISSVSVLTDHLTYELLRMDSIFRICVHYYKGDNPWLLKRNKGIIEISNQKHCKEFIEPIREEHFTPNSHWIIYEKNRRIIGFLRFLTDNNIANELTIEIDKNYCGKGIGTQLIKEFKKFAEKQGYSKVSCNIEIVNIGSIKLFEKHGFSFIDLTEKNGKEFAIYELNLKK